MVGFMGLLHEGAIQLPGEHRSRSAKTASPMSPGWHQDLCKRIYSSDFCSDKPNSTPAAAAHPTTRPIALRVASFSGNAQVFSSTGRTIQSRSAMLGELLSCSNERLPDKIFYTAWVAVNSEVGRDPSINYTHD
jgi:hypothetical protein